VSVWPGPAQAAFRPDGVGGSTGFLLGRKLCVCWAIGMMKHRFGLNYGFVGLMASCRLWPIIASAKLRPIIRYPQISR
jgi:hypothetical protein